MKAHFAIATALAALVLGTFHVTLSRACTDDRYLCEPATATSAEKPMLIQDYVRLASQKMSGAPAVELSARKNQRLRSSKSKTAKQQPQTTAPAAEIGDPDEPIPSIVVRTTRETGGEAAPVVSSEEFNELDRAAPSPSLAAATIMHYLGGSAAIEEPVSAPVSVADFPAEVRSTYAAASTEDAPKPQEIALEYILITFGGALAAASAIRLFAI